jgi:hypothetical protein
MALIPRQLGDLIRFLVQEAQDRQAELGRTRLAKLLYLIDVVHFGAHREQLTGIPWVFLHYGPYAVEIPRILDELDVDLPQEETTTAGGLRAYVFKRAGGPEVDIGRVLGSSAARSIRQVLDRWLEADMNELLSFVYFHTPPMKAARRRHEKLDFSTIPEAVPDALRESQQPLDQKTAEMLRDRATVILKKVRPGLTRQTPTPPPRYDRLYHESMRLLAETPRIPGGVEVSSSEESLDEFGSPTERQ